MKELSKDQKERLDECIENVGKMLLATMDVFNIPNFVNATYEKEGEFYQLEFKKISKPKKL